MIKKNFSLAVVALFFTVFANAQLCWKVSGNGLSKPSYLFGTHHLIESGQIKDFDKLLKLVAQTDAVVGEIDATDMALIQQKVMKLGMLNGTTIKSLLSPVDYSLVDAELKQYFGVGLDQLGIFKPMMLQSMYAVMVYNKSQNITKQIEGIDILFQKKALENNKLIIPLETFEQQAAILFDSLSLSRQAEILVKSVKEKEKGVAIFKKLNEAYLAGDLAKIQAVDKEDDDLTTAERKPLYDNRNNNWMTQLPAIFNKNSAFVAVGCMHLIGETGLINQLKKAGYVLEPMVQL